MPAAELFSAFLMLPLVKWPFLPFLHGLSALPQVQLCGSSQEERRVLASLIGGMERPCSSLAHFSGSQ